MDAERRSAAEVPVKTGMSAQPRHPALRRTLGAIAGCLLSAAILALIWHRHGIDLGVLLHESSRANAAVIAVVFVASAAFGLLVGAHKLHLVLQSMGARIRYRDTLLVRIASAPARALLPFASGELLQVLCFRGAARLPFARASGAVVFDKGLNLMAALLWLASGLVFLASAADTPPAIVRALPLFSCAVAAALLACAVAMFATPAHGFAVTWAGRIHPKLAGSLSGLLEPFQCIGFTRKLALIGYAMVFQARPLLVCQALIAALGLYPAPRTVLAASAAAVCAGYAPGFVAGSGPREAVLLELLRPAGVPAETGFFVGVLMTLSVNVLPAMIGAPWAMWLLRSLRASTQRDAAQEAP